MIVLEIYRSVVLQKSTILPVMKAQAGRAQFLALAFPADVKVWHILGVHLVAVVGTGMNC